jgi:hypothetical protein
VSSKATGLGTAFCGYFLRLFFAAIFCGYFLRLFFAAIFCGYFLRPPFAAALFCYLLQLFLQPLIATNQA